MVNKEEYAYAKGILVGIGLENFFMLCFLVVLSTPDGFSFFGLKPIWLIWLLFTMVGIIYFIQKRNKFAKRGNDVFSEESE